MSGIVPEQIRAGSVVRLKSGGPPMTARWVEHEESGLVSVCCDWFIEDKAPWKQESGVFPITSLKLLEP